jgi:HD-GYP domain-containing protein (c-di-GMP phosphodiesterase class II)
MRKILIDQVVDGMILANSILSPNGKVLLKAGVELNNSYLKRLKLLGISEIYIEDDISEGINVLDVVSEETRQEAMSIIQNVMISLRNDSGFDTKQVHDIAEKLISELVANRNVMVNLSDIKSLDGYTFEHSVNVCILSIILGIGMGFNMNRIKELGIGAFLHDIGKVLVPMEILCKPSQLVPEEFEVVKKHANYGFEILKKCDNISTISAIVAFGHHERLDGSGYPLKLRGESIHQFTRIVSVADVYDAMTSNRAYRKKLQPHEALEYLTALSNTQFDSAVVAAFKKHVAIYPVGSGVMLNNRQKGIVVKNNQNLPTRPVVRIIYNEYNQKLNDFYEIDLSERLNLFIIGICQL